MTLKETIARTICGVMEFFFIAILIFSPFACGLLWYYFVHEPISSAIMGIVCGAICDFLIIVMVQR